MEFYCALGAGTLCDTFDLKNGMNETFAIGLYLTVSVSVHTMHPTSWIITLCHVGAHA